MMSRGCMEWRRKYEADPVKEKSEVFAGKIIATLVQLCMLIFFMNEEQMMLLTIANCWTSSRQPIVVKCHWQRVAPAR